MKRFQAFIGLSFVIVSILLPSATLAIEIKLGYVNTAAVMKRAPQAENASRKLEREFSPRDNELSGKAKVIAKLEEELSQDGDVMTDRVRRELAQRIRSLKRELRGLKEELREEFNLRRNELQAEVTRIVIKAIRAMAKSENYDLILADSAIYTGKRVDITEKVIDELTADFRAGKR